MSLPKTAGGESYFFLLILKKTIFSPGPPPQIPPGFKRAPHWPPQNLKKPILLTLKIGAFLGWVNWLSLVLFVWARRGAPKKLGLEFKNNLVPKKKKPFP